jgi:hypothetical protein
LIGEGTRELLGDAYHVEFMEAAQLRGKAREIGIYRVFGRNAPAEEQEPEEESVARASEGR